MCREGLGGRGPIPTGAQVLLDSTGSTLICLLFEPFEWVPRQEQAGLGHVEVAVKGVPGTGSQGRARG